MEILNISFATRIREQIRDKPIKKNTLEDFSIVIVLTLNSESRLISLETGLEMNFRPSGKYNTH